MNRRTLMIVLAAVPLAVRAQTPLTTDSLTSALKNPLMGALTSQLGVSEDQARGGVGSYLTLLQEKLAKRDFDKIASLVPGASGYVDTAKKLGAVTGPLKNLAGLNGALGKLGMNAETIAKFTPLVTNYYLGKLGGPTVQSLLAGALK
ncbi:MAG TPA: DUF2780 domain-containing protein [Steroidobacteraceae bacterium]|nr:DUF2780 domain-containing protein [Steroidobacteraceae bacterium]